jgi:outer membrane murein-binding lipoprotein Lpp
MIKIMLVSLLLAGCTSLVFDSTEYDRYIGLIERTQKISLTCSQPADVKFQVSVLKDDVAHMNNYAMYRDSRKEIKNSTNQLFLLVEEMNTRYEQLIPPSKTYCEQKLRIISDAAKTVSFTLGKL